MSVAFEGAGVPEDATLDAFVSEADAGDEANDEQADRDESSGADAVGGDAADSDATCDDAADSDASGDDAGGDETPAAGGDETPTSSDEPAGGGVEPVAVTSSWPSGEAACGVCGESAGRLWEHDGASVCATCKPWTRTGESTCGR